MSILKINYYTIVLKPKDLNISYYHIVVMKFKNKDDLLTKRLDSGNISEKDLDEILTIEGKLAEPTKTVVNYLRDIASMAELQQIDDNYVIFGGYAVLAHMIRQHGNAIAEFWRGSDDIDMTGDITLLNSIRSQYFVSNDRASPNLKGKRTLKIISRGEPDETGKGECKIDYFQRDFDIEDTEKIDILGIPIRVFKPSMLIKSKLSVYKSENKQMIDIYNLLGVCEHRELGAKRLVQKLSQTEAQELYGFIKNLENGEFVARLSTGPSEQYTADLRTRLQERLVPDSVKLEE